MPGETKIEEAGVLWPLLIYGDGDPPLGINRFPVTVGALPFRKDVGLCGSFADGVSDILPELTVSTVKNGSG